MHALLQDTIRSLVEHQILPNFTAIFLQAEEGAGPGGEALDGWLEGLLAEMQGSIERHLKHVFQNGAGGGGGAGGAGGVRGGGATSHGSV